MTSSSRLFLAILAVGLEARQRARRARVGRAVEFSSQIAPGVAVDVVQRCLPFRRVEGAAARRGGGVPWRLRAGTAARKATSGASSICFDACARTSLFAHCSAQAVHDPAWLAAVRH